MSKVSRKRSESLAKKTQLKGDAFSRLNLEEASKGWQVPTGINFSPEGHQVNTFSWNLGMLSNNLAESYALLQGLIIANP